VTLSLAVRVVAPLFTVMVASVFLVTAVVVTLKVAVLLPGLKVMLAGTLAGDVAVRV
jgi:hypothetical protein